MKAAPELATEQDAYQYMMVAIRNSAYQMFARRSRRRDRMRQASAGHESDVLQRVLTTEAEDARSELRRRALQVVGELAPRHRQVIELLILHDPPLRLREVAAIQEAPISTVYSRLQSALRQLSRHLERGR